MYDLVGNLDDKDSHDAVQDHCDICTCLNGFYDTQNPTKFVNKLNDGKYSSKKHITSNDIRSESEYLHTSGNILQ